MYLLRLNEINALCRGAVPGVFRLVVLPTLGVLLSVVLSIASLVLSLSNHETLGIVFAVSGFALLVLTCHFTVRYRRVVLQHKWNILTVQMSELVHRFSNYETGLSWSFECELWDTEAEKGSFQWLGLMTTKIVIELVAPLQVSQVDPNRFLQVPSAHVRRN